MKSANYNIRLDPIIKAKAEETYAEFGLNLSEAINVFLHMSIKWRAFHPCDGFLGADSAAFGRRPGEFDKIPVFAVGHAETDIAGVLAVKDLKHLAVPAEKRKVKRGFELVWHAS